MRGEVIGPWDSISEKKMNYCWVRYLIAGYKSIKKEIKTGFKVHSFPLLYHSVGHPPS